MPPPDNQPAVDTCICRSQSYLSAHDHSAMEPRVSGYTCKVAHCLCNQPAADVRCVVCGLSGEALCNKHKYDEQQMVFISDIRPSRSRDLPWSWEDEDRNTRTRQCLCCGRPGHYQEMLEAHMAGYGVKGLGILVDNDGFVEDGHHRVIAAIHLGIKELPTETSEDCQARWVKDHGYVGWHHRKFGDK